MLHEIEGDSHNGGIKGQRGIINEAKNDETKKARLQPHGTSGGHRHYRDSHGHGGA